MNVPVLRPKDVPLVPKLRKLGIKMPIRMLVAAHEAAIPPSLAASVLMQETSGGANIFGHDQTIFVGAGQVTKAKYLAYKEQRGPNGDGGMQGVGPLQLTFFSLQDEADARGGCWKPFVNMLVGFEHLAKNIRRSGLHEGVRVYNGSGPDAEKYVNAVLPRAEKFKNVLGR